ncbi:DsbC family protein [Natronospira bacteriovora]|uniref:Thiol:disulfide interchange protein n=1 Tax=Natronospira bacteriovora TaxID=3069753 RepID=A0ABU0W6S8_9GAMM|nr:DsbC family protein [Natronospira sp. AB-CW4]MDQ2069463.1 DsbC family protein [Natronospira sp. AB-CW4]
MIRLSKFLVLFSCLLAGAAHAGNPDTRERIINGLNEHLPDLQVVPDQLEPTPIDGLWVLRIGPEVVYLDENGQYLIQGDLIELESRRNLTEATRAEARAAALETVPDSRKITFTADDEQFRLTVFTDIDCGYCRQLHRDMEALNEAGITVDYLFYPRGGPESAAWDKSDRVWCSDDRHEAMDHAKSGGTPEAERCEDTPTEEHFALGRQMQVTGTPALVTESGHMIRGYMPVARLVNELQSRENRQ